MASAKWVLVGAGSLGVALAATTILAERSPRVSSMPLVSSHQSTAAQTPATKAPQAVTPAAAGPDLTKIVPTYCINCHNDELKRGDLSFVKFDLAKAGQNQEVVERMIRKLAAGMMPPPGSRRPTPEVYQAFLTNLETRMDSAAVARPNPGARVFQRLNRAEYARAVRDLLAVSVDAGSWLPLDSMSANFDNIADEQGLSATLLEAYLNAAGDISRMAVGDKTAPAIDRTYTNTSYMSQHPWDQLEGAPHGTRGGMVVDHVFPADAEYVFAVNIISGDNTRLEDIDISIDGERVALIRYENGQQRDADGRGATPIPAEAVFIKAGQHKVAATFVRRFDGPYEDLIRPHDWSYAGGGSGGSGITTLPHLRDLLVKGPYKTTGLSETPSRKKIFSCRPTTVAEERPCARTIVTRLGGEAYRRPLSAKEVDAIMPFYDAGTVKGGFEGGVTTAVEAILSSLHFIFRLEREPANVKPGAIYKVSDYDLASRLSFFLWGAPPDKELLTLAGRGELGLHGDTRKTGPPDARRSAQRGARLAVRRTVAAAAGHREGPSRSELLPELRRQPRRDDAPRDRDVLQPSRPRRWQRSRSLSRRLHVRERTAGAALRVPGRRRQRVPQDRSTRTTRAAACSARAACWCRRRTRTGRRRCCAASG